MHAHRSLRARRGSSTHDPDGNKGSGGIPARPEFEELDRWYLEQHPEVRERCWENLWRQGRR